LLMRFEFRLHFLPARVLGVTVLHRNARIAMRCRDTGPLLLLLARLLGGGEVVQLGSQVVDLALGIGESRAHLLILGRDLGYLATLMDGVTEQSNAEGNNCDDSRSTVALRGRRGLCVIL